jgi:hypothetical protein
MDVQDGAKGMENPDPERLWLRRRDRGRPQPSARERKEHDVLVGRGACERLGVAGLALCGPHKSGGPWL